MLWLKYSLLCTTEMARPFGCSVAFVVDNVEELIARQLLCLNFLIQATSDKPVCAIILPLVLPFRFPPVRPLCSNTDEHFHSLLQHFCTIEAKEQ